MSDPRRTLPSLTIVVGGRTMPRGSALQGQRTAPVKSAKAANLAAAPKPAEAARPIPDAKRRAASVNPTRIELGRFLKACRAKLQPEDLGMAPGPRRRTPGLRREEVALMAGVGLTWYTWLEQGRPINASAQVLDAISRTLRLDAAGRWHLYRLAEATPLRTWCGPEQVPDAVRA